MLGAHRTRCASMWLAFTSQAGRDVLLSSDRTSTHLPHSRRTQHVLQCSWPRSAAVMAHRGSCPAAFSPVPSVPVFQICG